MSENTTDTEKNSNSSSTNKYEEEKNSQYTKLEKTWSQVVEGADFDLIDDTPGSEVGTKSSESKAVFGVDITSTKETISSATNALTGYVGSFDQTDKVEDIENTWDEMTDSFSSAGSLLSETFDDEQGWSDLGSAAASAALKFLNSKLEILKSVWTQTEEVSVGEIIGEIAPYAVYTKALPNLIGQKLLSMCAYIVTLGDASNFSDALNGTLVGVLNEFLETMLNDPSVASATGNLKVMQGVASGLSGISKSIDVITKTMSLVEPYLPIIDIIADMAMAMWSGGQSGVKATQSLAEYMANLCQELLARCFDIMKKMIFGIKFKMPVLLTGALNNLKLAEADILEEYGDDEELLAEKKKEMASTTAFLQRDKTSESLTSGTASSYYNVAKTATTSASAMVTTFSDKVKSGDLISAPHINSWTDWDFSKVYAGYTNTWNNFTDQVTSASKKAAYTSSSAQFKMKVYAQNARRRAGIQEIEHYETASSSAGTGSSSDTSIPEKSSNLQLALDELTIKKASGDMLPAIIAGEISQDMIS